MSTIAIPLLVTHGFKFNVICKLIYNLTQFQITVRVALNQLITSFKIRQQIYIHVQVYIHLSIYIYIYIYIYMRYIIREIVSNICIYIGSPSHWQYHLRLCMQLSMYPFICLLDCFMYCWHPYLGQYIKAAADVAIINMYHHLSVTHAFNHPRIIYYLSIMWTVLYDYLYHAKYIKT